MSCLASWPDSDTYGAPNISQPWPRGVWRGNKEIQILPSICLQHSEETSQSSQNAVWENTICATKHTHLKAREVCIIHSVGGGFRETVVPEKFLNRNFLQRRYREGNSRQETGKGTGRSYPGDTRHFHKEGGMANTENVCWDLEWDRAGEAPRPWREGTHQSSRGVETLSWDPQDMTKKFEIRNYPSWSQIWCGHFPVGSTKRG